MSTFEKWARNIMAEEEAEKTEGSNDVAEKVASFLSDNPTPNDEAVHAFAEKEGIEKDEVENELYKIATAFFEFFKEGKAYESGTKEADVDPEQLKMGIEVEYEHTNDEAVAKKIALDHLAEIKDYYTRLKKMEDEAKAEGSDTEAENKDEEKKADTEREAVAPPGAKYERMVKHIKEKGKGKYNPWAVAWSKYNEAHGKG